MADDDVDSPVVAAAPPVLHPWLEPLAREMLARRARWPHALLVAGPEGVGKRDLARFFAQALLCERPSPAGFPCNACESCHYVAAGQHPDLRLVEPLEVDDDGNVTAVEWINVDRIRALIDWVQLTSHRRVAKVAIIAPAERMNPVRRTRC
jgi:DNA polymerase-3 subunit delta'